MSHLKLIPLLIEESYLYFRKVLDLLISNLSSSRLQSLITLVLFWQNLMLQHCDIISLVLFIDLCEKEDIQEEVIQEFHVFGLYRFKIM